ncbi:MAG: hypothetical protein SGPRY_014528 [Prymnesium sp.]
MQGGGKGEEGGLSVTHCYWLGREGGLKFAGGGEPRALRKEDDGFAQLREDEDDKTDERGDHLPNPREHTKDEAVEKSGPGRGVEGR